MLLSIITSCMVIFKGSIMALNVRMDSYYMHCTPLIIIQSVATPEVFLLANKLYTIKS